MDTWPNVERQGFFCAGGDLKGFQNMAEASKGDVIEMSETIGSLLYKLDRLPIVTIALIEGAAIAGGLGLACCCDLTIGTADARFAFSETRIGISPAQIALCWQKCGTCRPTTDAQCSEVHWRWAAARNFDVVVADSNGLPRRKRIRRTTFACPKTMAVPKL